MKNVEVDKAYNRYNFEARSPRPNRYEVGSDVELLKKKFQTHRSSIANSSYLMFWVSVAITVSYIVSQVYLMLSR